MTRRIWTGLMIAFLGLFVAVVGPVWVTQSAPMVHYPLCKGNITILGLCDAYAHSVRGQWLVALVAFIIGGIVLVITGCVVMGTKGKR